MRHWMTHYDPADGAPYADLCDCGLDEDHTAADYRAYIDELERALAEEAEKEK